MDYIRQLLFLSLASVLCGCGTSRLSKTNPYSCQGIDRMLSGERKAALAPRVAKQLQAQLPGLSAVDVLQSFRQGDWTVLYVDTHESDEAFLFYSADPLSHRYITLWSGGAAKGEEADIMQWTAAHAPGIPRRLAACFAHVAVYGNE